MVEDVVKHCFDNLLPPTMKTLYEKTDNITLTMSPKTYNLNTFCR